MHATAELQVIPIGNSVSVRKEIMRVVELLQQGNNFKIDTHASGTNIEGDLSDILKAVELVHKTLHDESTVRLVSYLKLETRTDKNSTLSGKML